MDKESQNQSLLDILFRLQPELKPKGQKTDNTTAKILYSLWKAEDSKAGEMKFRRPESVKEAEVDALQRAGLVSVQGGTIEITKKGSEIIRQMILGDDRSTFDDDGIPVSYLTALANLKPSRKGKHAKTASAECGEPRGSNWYTQNC